MRARPERRKKLIPKVDMSRGNTLFSFAGYLPADHPEFVGLVVLDDAHTSKPELNYGGSLQDQFFPE